MGVMMLDFNPRKVPALRQSPAEPAGLHVRMQVNRDDTRSATKRHRQVPGLPLETLHRIRLIKATELG